MRTIETQTMDSRVQTTERPSLIDEALRETRLTPSDEGYFVARQGVEALVKAIIEPEQTPSPTGDKQALGRRGDRIDRQLVDSMIAEIDACLGRQLDQILHHPKYQALESAWRGLKFLVDRTDFRENQRVEIVDVTKQELQADFQEVPEIVKSGLYKLAYTSEYGTFGGEPYGAIIGNYEFSHQASDIELLRNCAAVATMAHAPFLSAVGPSMFGIDSFERLPGLKDLRSIFEGPQYARWNAFRDSDDARSVGLTAPRFLLRLPYGRAGSPVSSFAYEEQVTDGHHRYLWGNAAFALATRLTESFANYRWCPNIIGPQAGGSVDNLPLHTFEYMGEVQNKVPTDVLISERREFELAEEGFIALVARKESPSACFFSANSCQRAKTFGQSAEGKQAELNHRLGTQLPYLLVVNRLAHYIKVLQREQIGSWRSKSDLERELNRWISQYVTDMDNPAPGVRGRRPLRQAQILVEEVPGNAGWYQVDLKVRPHFKYMGAFFTLSLVGKLDKE